MKPIRLLLLTLLLFPFAGKSQNDSFGLVRLTTSISRELPVFGTTDNLNMDNGGGFSLAADVYLNQKLDFTLKYLYKLIPFDAKGRVLSIHPEGAHGGFVETEYTPWQIHSVCGGLRLKALDRGNARTIIEAYGGVGWFSVLSGNVTLKNSMEDRTDFIYVEEASTGRREFALGATVKEEFISKKGWIWGFGLTYFSFDHLNQYKVTYEKGKPKALNEKPTITEKFLQERAFINLLGVQLSLSFRL